MNRRLIEGCILALRDTDHHILADAWLKRLRVFNRKRPPRQLPEMRAERDLNDIYELLLRIAALLAK